MISVDALVVSSLVARNRTIRFLRPAEPVVVCSALAAVLVVEDVDASADFEGDIDQNNPILSALLYVPESGCCLLRATVPSASVLNVARDSHFLPSFWVIALTVIFVLDGKLESVIVSGSSTSTDCETSILGDAVSRMLVHPAKAVILAVPASVSARLRVHDW